MSIKVDFSKAPDGATHYTIKDGGEVEWYRHLKTGLDGPWFKWKDEWSLLSTRRVLRALRDMRKIPEKGRFETLHRVTFGLPPESHCEVLKKIGGQHKWCECYAVDFKKKLIVWRDPDHHHWHRSPIRPHDKFQSLRSDREKAIDKVSVILATGEVPDGKNPFRWRAGQLYDAGVLKDVE